MSRDGRPIRFLATVALLWVGGRAVTLWPVAAEAFSAAGLPWVYARTLPADPPVARGAAVRAAVHGAARRGAGASGAGRRPVTATGATGAAVTAAAVDAQGTLTEPIPNSVTTAVQPALIPPAPRARSRLTVSAWAMVRPGHGGSLAGGGQLGASQAGVRARYALTPAVAIAARLSAPLGGGGRETALGMEWKPARALPLWLAAERRWRPGTDGFALGGYGGIDRVALPAGLLLDAYGQAGMVGLKRRQAYGDGAVRVERRLAEGRRASLSVGGGLWGAAQPGVARVDIGPQLVARIPLGATTIRAGLDWRYRIAGDARPGSGPALSIGADF